MADLGESGIRRNLLRPVLDSLALDLDTPAAVTAGQVMVVGITATAPVQGLAAGVPDRVDPAVLAEHLQVAVDGGEPDVLTQPAQLGVDLLGTAESRQPIEGG